MSKTPRQSGGDPPAAVSREYKPLKFTGFLSDMWFITRRPCSMIRMARGAPVAPAFRERLMLAVTAVTGCRYCSWAHTGAALRSGISKDEVAGLLIGSVDDCPPDEAIAVLYAQHWADSDGSPDPEARERLIQSYDADTVNTIDVILHSIRIGNYIGIFHERLLKRISFSGRGGRGGSTNDPD
ncbi:MAG: carboxymuconolactone decarboxylase family protein [Dehalococcoidia bacterium]